MAGGPDSAVYGSSSSGWFNSFLFERWFLEVFMVYVDKVRTDPAEKVCLIGDSLGSHFNGSLVQVAKEKNVVFCMLPIK